MIKTKCKRNPSNNSIMVMSEVDEMELLYSNEMIRTLVDKVSNIIADEIIKHHLPEVLEKISPEAIATMTIASAGAKINETLNKKMPDKIINTHTTSREIYQKGIFSGLKRVL